MRFINFLTYSTAHIIASFVWMSFSATAMADILDSNENPDYIVPHKKTIGAMIPLTGKYKNLGEMISRSVTMAWYDFAPKDFKLNIYDTQSSHIGAINGYKQANIDNIKMVVGPLTRDGTATVANYNVNDITNLSLTNDSYYGQSNIIIMGYTPQSQGVAISKILEYKDFKRALLLVPDDDFGEGIIDGINSHSNSRIVHTIYYRSTAVDFTDLVKNLVERKIYYQYDTIILPDGNPNTIRTLAAQLAFYDAQDPYVDPDLEPYIDPNIETMIGPQLEENMIVQQDEPPLVPIEDRIPMIGGLGWQALNGAHKEPPLLNGYYIKIPSTPHKAVFDKKYKELYGEKPTPLARLAYDTMAISITTTNTDYPLDSLRQSTGFSGISGNIKIFNYGKTTRGYNIMKVLRDKSVHEDTISILGG